MKLSVLFSFLLFCIFSLLLAFVPKSQVLHSSLSPAKDSPGLKGLRKPAPAVNPYYIVVDKSDYELKVYDDEGWYATYPIVFGSRDLSDKMKEGDKKTPDGH